MQLAFQSRYSSKLCCQIPDGLLGDARSFSCSEFAPLQRTKFHSFPRAVSSILHPSTYINKILLGSHQGKLQLWNIKSNKLIYSFDGWNSGVTVLAQAPAIDVVAIGLADGRIVLHNLRCFGCACDTMCVRVVLADGRIVLHNLTCVGCTCVRASDLVCVSLYVSV